MALSVQLKLHRGKHRGVRLELRDTEWVDIRLGIQMYQLGEGILDSDSCLTIHELPDDSLVPFLVAILNLFELIIIILNNNLCAILSISAIISILDDYLVKV